MDIWHVHVETPQEKIDMHDDHVDDDQEFPAYPAGALAFKTKQIREGIWARLGNPDVANSGKKTCDFLM